MVNDKKCTIKRAYAGKVVPKMNSHISRSFLFYNQKNKKIFIRSSFTFQSIVNWNLANLEVIVLEKTRIMSMI